MMNCARKPYILGERNINYIYLVYKIVYGIAPDYTYTCIYSLDCRVNLNINVVQLIT